MRISRMLATALLALWGGASAFAGSAVFWASDPIGPGETALVFGGDLPDTPRVEVTRLPDGPAGEPQKGLEVRISEAREVPPVQPNAQSIKFTLPKSFAPGLFAYRIGGRTGMVTGVLNRPAGWWTLGDGGTFATPGGWVRVFGKNLHSPAKAQERATLRLQGPKSVLLAAEGDAYAVKAALPPDLPQGEYDLYLHTGCGGTQGWSEPVKLKVAAAKPWPDKVFNVKAHGAEGSGIKDDTAAIQAALQAAGKNGGGVVYFPRGRYRVSATLVLPRFTVLRGEKEALVALAWADFPDPPEALVSGSNSFALEDLTLYAKEHCHIIMGDLGNQPAAGNVSLHRVRIRADRYRGHPTEEDVDRFYRRALKMAGASRGDAVRLGGANVQITECDIYGSGRSLYLSRVRCGRIEGNRFYNGRRGWYCIAGSDGLAFTGNEVIGADLQASGGGLNCLDGSSYSQNVYYAHNRLQMMHGWDREVMTSDAGGEAYYGKIAVAGGTRLELAGTPAWGKRDGAGAGVFILDGRGAGQYRRVVKGAGQTVELDRPWQIEPDRDSLLSITMFQGHYALIGNEFTDTGAAQFYGISIENIMDGNTGTRMSGLSCLGLWYHGYQPSWFCQMLGNTLREGNYYHWNSATEASLKVEGATRAPYSGPLNRAAVVRGNRLENNAMIRVEGSCRDAIVEGNRIADVEQGIFVSEKTAGVLVRDNVFDGVLQPQVDEAAIRAAELARLKRLMGGPNPVAYWGFDEMFAGGFPDSSGNGFHAKAAGEGKFVLDGDAVHGRALRFGGANYLRVEEPAVFNAPDITFCFWLKPASLVGRHGLLVKRFGNTGAPFVIGQDGPRVRVAALEAGGPWSFNFESPPLLAPNAWSHVGVVFTAGKGVTIYINGRCVAEKACPAEREINHDPLFLGRDAVGGGSGRMNTPGFYAGWLDEVKIWLRPLTAEEILTDATRKGN